MYVTQGQPLAPGEGKRGPGRPKKTSGTPGQAGSRIAFKCSQKERSGAPRPVVAGRNGWQADAASGMESAAGRSVRSSRYPEVWLEAECAEVGELARALMEGLSLHALGGTLNKKGARQGWLLVALLSTPALSCLLLSLIFSAHRGLAWRGVAWRGAALCSPPRHSAALLRTLPPRVPSLLAAPLSDQMVAGLASRDALGS